MSDDVEFDSQMSRLSPKFQTLSPWDMRAPVAPPPHNLQEWYHFVQETRLINNVHVTIKKIGMHYGYPPFFQNGRHQ